MQWWKIMHPNNARRVPSNIFHDSNHQAYNYLDSYGSRREFCVKRYDEFCEKWAQLYDNLAVKNFFEEPTRGFDCTWSFKLHCLSINDLIVALKNVKCPDKAYLITNNQLEILNKDSGLKVSILPLRSEKANPAISCSLYYNGVEIANYFETCTLTSYASRGVIHTMHQISNSQTLKNNWLSEQMVEDIQRKADAIPGIRFWFHCRTQAESDLLSLLKSDVPLIDKQNEIQKYLESNINQRLVKIITQVKDVNKTENQPYFTDKEYHEKSYIHL